MNTLPYSLRFGLVALMLAPVTALIALAAAPLPQPGTVLILPPESPRWELEANAKPAEFLGRKCLMLNGGAAVVRDLELRDGVVDVDVATPAERGFFGFQFRLQDEGANGETIYLRQHKSGLADAMQYTPILGTGLNWQLYSGPGFTGPVNIPRNEWFHLRLVLAGAQAQLYVKDMDKPALVMSDLKSGLQQGQLALWVLTGATCFANMQVRATADVPWQRQWPAMPADALTQWQLSPAYDVQKRDPEQALSAADSQAINWQTVQAEPPGLVPITRYRTAPHPRVSFANDWRKRLDPQPGAQLIYARTVVDADREQVRKLLLGYSDEVSVFLNGQILYRGRSAQYFRDPGFLGIVDAENDAIYLPLKKGRNELLLAITELGGGWGFVARLEQPR